MGSSCLLLSTSELCTWHTAHLSCRSKNKQYDFISTNFKFHFFKFTSLSVSLNGTPLYSSNKLQHCYRLLEYLGDLKVQQTRWTNCWSSSWIWVQGTYFHLVCEPLSGPDLDPCLDLKQTWKTQVTIIFMIKIDEGKHVVIIKYVIIMKEKQKAKSQSKMKSSFYKSSFYKYTAIFQMFKACWFPA